MSLPFSQSAKGSLSDAQARTRTALKLMGEVLATPPLQPYDVQELRRIRTFLQLAAEAVSDAIRNPGGLA